MKKEKIYIGLAIILVVVIAIFMINNNKEEVVEEEEKEPEITIPEGCSTINLEIVGADAARKILTIKRGVGAGDLDKIQVKINEDVSQVNAQNVNEGKEQVFVIDMNFNLNLI